MHKAKRDCFALCGSGGRDKDPSWYRERTPWLSGSRESTGKIWGEDKLRYAAFEYQQKLYGERKDTRKIISKQIGQAVLGAAKRIGAFPPHKHQYIKAIAQIPRTQLATISDILSQRRHTWSSSTVTAGFFLLTSVYEQPLKSKQCLGMNV